MSRLAAMLSHSFLAGTRDIQHSMLTLGDDSWIGANNRNSLGMVKGDALYKRNEVDGIITYSKMSQKKYDPPIGGWNNDNKLVNVYGNPYELYVIPLIGTDYKAPPKHTFCEIQ